MRRATAQIEVELDADDIRHLMSNGKTAVDCPESENMNIQIVCKESLQFQVVSPSDGKPWGESDE